jgi:hypothetical protein
VRKIEKEGVRKIENRRTEKIGRLMCMKGEGQASSKKMQAARERERVCRCRCYAKQEPIRSFREDLD